MAAHYWIRLDSVSPPTQKNCRASQTFTSIFGESSAGINNALFFYKTKVNISLKVPKMLFSFRKKNEKNDLIVPCGKQGGGLEHSLHGHLLIFHPGRFDFSANVWFLNSPQNS